MNGKAGSGAKQDLERWYNRIYTHVKSPKDLESWYQRLTDANPDISKSAEAEFMTKLGQGQMILNAEFALMDVIAAIASLRAPQTGSKLGIVPGGGSGGKGNGAIGGKGGK